MDLQEERRIVQRLYDTVIQARDTGDPLLRQEYGRVLNAIEEIRHYFERMIKALDNTAFDAEKLSMEIGRMLQDDIDQIQSLNNRMML